MTEEFSLVGKKGAWVNQYAQPSLEKFLTRAKEVDYLVLKYGLQGGLYEREATRLGKPWLAEMFMEEHGDVVAQTDALMNQALQPGCVGIVLNVEYWTRDDGSKTRAMLDCIDARFKNAGRPKLPVYACVDTRAGHLNYPYQRILADRCDAVMPMCYAGAFGQSPESAASASLNLAAYELWGRFKPVLPVIQAYAGVGPDSVKRSVDAVLSNSANGLSVYTLGHATEDEWRAFVGTTPETKFQTEVVDGRDLRIALLQLRTDWYDRMTQLARTGTVDDVAAFVTYWKGLGK